MLLIAVFMSSIFSVRKKYRSQGDMIFEFLQNSIRVIMCNFDCVKLQICYKLNFSCLINHRLFDCNYVGRKLRWSLKEFDLTRPFQGSCPSANLKCPGELQPTQASFVPPLLFKYKRTRNQ